MSVVQSRVGSGNRTEFVAARKNGKSFLTRDRLRKELARASGFEYCMRCQRFMSLSLVQRIKHLMACGRIE